MTAQPVSIVGITGIGEIGGGDDLGALLIPHLRAIAWPEGASGLLDGDVIVVTSKIVSKAEGQVRPVDERAAAIAEDTIDIVARKTSPRGITSIVRNPHGVVLAAAGVDESNAPAGYVLMLPRDPDASAQQLRTHIQDSLGIQVGVIITDTLGRPWREGLTDAAIGISGVSALDDLRGQVDANGVALEVSIIAVADEIAAAADLVKRKTAGIPVAVVRGLARYVGASGSARDLIRPPADDLFTLGTAEARHLGRQTAAAHRRTVRSFTDQPVPERLIEEAIRDATYAPAPHQTKPWQFIWPQTATIRAGLLDNLAAQWREDLTLLDGLSDDAIESRVRRGDLLRQAPDIVCAFADMSAAHSYTDERRQMGERDLFVAAGSAGVQNFMIRLAADGLGSAWVSSSMFCPNTIREYFGLPTSWLPLGIVAIGWPKDEPFDRQPAETIPLQRL